MPTCCRKNWPGRATRSARPTQSQLAAKILRISSVEHLRTNEVTAREGAGGRDGEEVVLTNDMTGSRDEEFGEVNDGPKARVSAHAAPSRPARVDRRDGVGYGDSYGDRYGVWPAIRAVITRTFSAPFHGLNW